VNLGDFYQTVQDWYEGHPHLRYGQAIMDMLYLFAPEIYMSLIGTELDPYELQYGHGPAMEPFHIWLAKRWREQ
jgi:hypothetical protein